MAGLLPAAAGLLWAVVLLAPVPAGAQDTLPLPRDETLLRYLQQDIFINPGSGLKAVQLGHSFEHVLATWGRPRATGRAGFLGSDRAWIYEGGRNTTVVLVGDDTVERMEVRGNLSSPYQTTEGARFGMPRHQVLSMYGRPGGDAGPERVEYPARGVAFGFHNGSLRSIEVFGAGG